jgi:hypothetical protein
LSFGLKFPSAVFCCVWTATALFIRTVQKSGANFAPGYGMREDA